MTLVTVVTAQKQQGAICTIYVYCDTPFGHNRVDPTEEEKENREETIEKYCTAKRNTVDLTPRRII